MYDAADVIYLYDGSMEGFLCCVYESVYSHTIPVDILPEDDAQPTLFRQQYIETDTEKAGRVWASIPKRISSEAAQLVWCVFLSCMPGKELAILRFLLLGYRHGRQVTYLVSHQLVQPLLAARQNLLNEAHLLKEFIRFSDYDGVLAATITPKNFVLPFMTEHFYSRLKTEDFLIFDRTHHAAVVYQNKEAHLISLDALELPPVTAEEQRFRILWKQFYNTIAIEARTNPRCRMTHCPKRYWENMPEMEEALRGTPDSFDARAAWDAAGEARQALGAAAPEGSAQQKRNTLKPAGEARGTLWPRKKEDLPDASRGDQWPQKPEKLPAAHPLRAEFSELPAEKCTRKAVQG